MTSALRRQGTLLFARAGAAPGQDDQQGQGQGQEQGGLEAQDADQLPHGREPQPQDKDDRHE